MLKREIVTYVFLIGIFFCIADLQGQEFYRSIESIRAQMAGAPEADCNSPVADYPTCQEAEDNAYCDLNDLEDYCTDMTDTGSSASEPIPGCATSTLQNPSYITFVASATTLEIRIIPSACDTVWLGPIPSFGIQVGIYPDCDSDQPIFSQCPCTDDTITAIANTYELGERYTILIDGCSGDMCHVEIDIIEGGPGLLPIDEFNGPGDLSGPGIAPEEAVCAGAENQVYTILETAGGYEEAYAWEFWDGTVDTTEGQTYTISQLPDMAGTYQICVKAINFCDENTQICQDIVVYELPDIDTCVCICYEDLDDYMFFDQDIDQPGLNVLPWENDIGCDFNYNLYLEVSPEPVPEIVVRAICNDMLPYTHPGQDESVDPPFTGPVTDYDMTLPAASQHNCNPNNPCAYDEDPVFCDSLIEFTLIVMNVEGSLDTIIQMGCADSIALGVSHLTFTPPLDDIDLDWQFDWRDEQGNQIGFADDTVVYVTEPGLYTLTITMQYLGADSETCTFGPYGYEVIDDGSGQVTDTIVGPDSLCVGEVGEFSISFLPGSTNYTWSVDANGNLISGQGSTVMRASWFASGQGTVSLVVDGECIGEIPDFNVTILDGPSIDPGQPDTICGVLTTVLSALPGTGSGLWTQVSGPGTTDFVDSTMATTDITVSNTGVYTYQWSEEQFGCYDSASVVLTFAERPEISIDTSFCAGDNMSYTVRFVVNQGQAPYSWNSMPGGMEISPGVYEINGIAVGANYRVSMTDAFGCMSNELSGTVACDCDNEAGMMDAALIEACEGDTIIVTTLTAPVQDDNDTLVYVLHSNGTANLGNQIYDIRDDSVFVYQTSYPLNDTLYISVVIGDVLADSINLSDPCLQVAPGQPVIWYQNPIANAGMDNDTCGLNYTLSAIPTVGQGEWLFVSGAGNAVILLPGFWQTDVTVDAYGSYLFEWVEDNGGCISRDTVEIVFRDSPRFVGVPSFECSEDNISYRVSLRIEGGDSTSYTVTDPRGLYGGTLNGRLFTSDDILRSDSFVFQVVDQYGCGTDIVADTADCRCLSYAGELMPVTDSLCETDAYTVHFDSLPTLDANDALQWVVFDPVLFQVVARFSDSVISFVPPMQFGTTYIITTFVGNDDGTGSVDTSDPCFSFAPGVVRLTWFEDPEFTSMFSSDQNCLGDSIRLYFAFQGAGPFEIRLTDGSDFYTFSGLNAIDSVRLLMTQANTTYTLIELREMNGAQCSVMPNASVSPDFEEPPTVDLEDVVEVCNKDFPGQSTIVDFGNYIISGDINGTWVDLDNSGGLGSLPILDFAGVPPGTYRFEYTTGLNLFACNNAVDTLVLNVTDTCTCPIIDILTIPDICNSELSRDLNQYKNITFDGVWSIVSAPPGSNPLSVSGTTLNIQSADTGLYVIEFKASNFGDICPDSSRQEIRVFGVPNPGTAEPLSFCEDDDLLIDVFDQLTGEDPNGTLRMIEAADFDGVQFDAQTGLLRTSMMKAGRYVIEYLVGPYGPCPAERTLLEINVLPKPIADAGQELLFGCTTRSGTIGGVTTSVGDQYRYRWYRDGMELDGVTGSTVEVMMQGWYLLEVTNTMTGCVAIDSVLVRQDPNTLSGVVLDIRDERCEGEAGGVLAVSEVLGGRPPYTYRIDGIGTFSAGLISDLPPGDYVLTVIDDDGCLFEEAFAIQAAQPLTVDSIEDIRIAFGDSVLVSLTINRDIDELSRIQWFGTDPCDLCVERYLRPYGTTVYSVLVVDENGCEAMVRFKIIVVKNNDVYVPNAFVPDRYADQENSVFRIYGTEALEMVEQLQIYDRWGNLMFSARNRTPQDMAWDGRIDGALAPPGVYVFYAKLRFADGSTELLRGDITLIR